MRRKHKTHGGRQSGQVKDFRNERSPRITYSLEESPIPGSFLSNRKPGMILVSKHWRARSHAMKGEDNKLSGSLPDLMRAPEPNIARLRDGRDEDRFCGFQQPMAFAELFEHNRSRTGILKQMLQGLLLRHVSRRFSKLLYPRPLSQQYPPCVHTLEESRLNNS